MTNMKHCIDEEVQWPDASVEAFEKKLRSIFRRARGIDTEGRILRGAELRNSVAEHDRRMQEWEEFGMKESPFGLIALYNGGRLISGTGKFRNYTYQRSLHELDPQAGLQIRARCSSRKEEEVLLGSIALQGIHHEGEEELLLPLDNGYTVGVVVKQIGERRFEVYFRCVENGIVTFPSRVYVSNEPVPDVSSGELKSLILKIRHLAKKQRYEEALGCARQAIRIAPEYWPMRITLGTMLVMSGEVDDGNKFFQQTLKDFSGNPKAVAAGLHCCAWVKEIRYGLNPPAEHLQEITRLYEEALQLDGSLNNTRACLLISLLSHEAEREQELLKDSVLCEGFLDALQFELAERGEACARKVLQALPAQLGNLLRPVAPNYAMGYGC
jgi:tetratricopeptide (TPR) repeat protein